MNWKLILAAGVVICLAIAVLLGAVYVLQNPQLVIKQHRDRMNAAAETILQGDVDPAAAEEALDAFVWHRDQLVRLEALETRTYVATLRMRTPEAAALTDALIEKCGGLPVCEWRPDTAGLVITIWGSEQEMLEWEALMDEHQATLRTRR